MWLCGVVVLVIIFLILSNKKKTEQTNVCKTNMEEKLPYRKKKYLLSKAEYNFYKVLSTATKNESLYICPKVRLADIIYISNTSNRQAYWNKIQSKHIDFLICKDDFMNPLLAIELDDSTHNRKDRIERDEFLNKALESAGLPILRVKADAGYNPNELNLKINELLNKGSEGGELREENKG